MELALTRSRLWGFLDSRLDRVAMTLSGMCLVHCIATTVLLAAVASAGGLLSPAIHEVGLSLAIMLGIIGLGRGIMRHGYMLPAAVGGFGLGMMAGALGLPHDGTGTEAVWTMVGVLTLALGHDLNRRATY